MSSAADLVFATDGARSGLAFFCGVMILMAALIFGPRASAAASFASVFLYGLAEFAINAAVIRNVVGLVLVGALSTLLAARLRRAGGELRDLQEKATRAEQWAAIGRAATGLAHEIRNPLGSISGSVQLVRDAENLSEEDRRLLGIVLSEVQRLDALVTRILDVGRPRELHSTGFDARALASDVAQMLRAGPASAAEVEIVVDEGSAAPTWGDPNQIRQVLWNLLTNAIQASPKQAQVSVSVRARDGRSVLEVADHGPGISDAVRPHLFELFNTGRPDGVGIGLAMAKQIVDAHGGVIDVETSGSGTTFRVTLPSRPPV